MTGRAFIYDEKLLRECAGSNMAAFVATQAPRDIPLQDAGSTGLSSTDDNSCISLFKQHAAHYGHRHSLEDVQRLERLSSGNNTGSSLVSYRLGKKLHNFVRNVAFVYDHNFVAKDQSHRVTLNRFADLQTSEVIRSNRRWNQDNDRHLLFENKKVWEYGAFDDDDFQAAWGGKVGIITSLSSSQMIRDVAANLAIGKGSYNKLKPKHKKHKHDDSCKIVEVPLDDPEAFKAPATDDAILDGTLMSIKESQEHKYYRKHPERFNTTKDSNTVDNFKTNLDWATTNNPDGVGIVNGAFDQGKCGSCWAFAAAGSLEASASRKAAFDAYTYFESNNYKKMNNNTVRDHAFAVAQRVERQTIQFANLSIQELLDCDTAADQGCTGGNPLLAFYFIHRYGLTSWEEYPYVGFEEKCKTKLRKHPVATAKSWGIISPNHERHMELALRNIGPVAVGIDGANPSFLAYSGGVFDSHQCKQTANHALLITGYGQEELQDGSIVRYWIARNSWGPDWGENGYVRVKRGKGGKGKKGVCGIARSPSVALGGIIVRKMNVSYADLGIRDAVPFVPGETQFQRVCTRLGLNPEGSCGSIWGWIDEHNALSAGFLGIFCGMLALWLLTRDYRRRRRQRRAREIKRQQEFGRQKARDVLRHDNTESSPLVQRNNNEGPEDTESSPLLPEEGRSDSAAYGA